VPLSQERWLDRDPSLDAGVRRFREARALDLLVVMSGYQEEGRPALPVLPAAQVPAGFRRELGLCAREPPLAERAEAFLRSLPLRLAGFTENDRTECAPEVRWFRQGATEHSRKRLQPLLRAWLEGAGPESAGPAGSAGGTR
jgi:hypothetical protein